MNTLLNLLAVAGGAAAAWQTIRAALRLVRGGASGIWAEEMGRTHARHGDLTSLQQAQRDRLAARRGARRAGLEVLGWTAVLVAPSLTSWPRPLYAAYSLLWAGPVARWIRARSVDGAGGSGR